MVLECVDAVSNTGGLATSSLTGSFEIFSLTISTTGRSLVAKKPCCVFESAEFLTKDSTVSSSIQVPLT
jgi:hypothetical protein